MLSGFSEVAVQRGAAAAADIDLRDDSTAASAEGNRSGARPTF